MKMVAIGEFINGFLTGYEELIGMEIGKYSALVSVFVFSILIAIYAVFTWKFYRYLSKKDLIGLNLGQYNRTTHPFANKFIASLLYLIEYIIILPFLIFFWFAVLSIIILVLSSELVVEQVIVVSAAIVTAIRMLSYYEEDLSKDLAKMFPFTVLTIFILSPGFFSMERVYQHMEKIPSFLNSIALFLVLIVGVELVFRIIDTVLNLFKSEIESEMESDSDLAV